MRYSPRTGTSPSSTDSVQETLQHLRFTRVDYKWFRQATEYSYFSFEGPADGTVGYWDGGRFNQVD